MFLHLTIHLPLASGSALPASTPRNGEGKKGAEKLLHPHAVCAEETSQSQGPCWVRKQTQPALGRSSPLGTISWSHALAVAKAKRLLQTQWARANQSFLQIPACRKHVLGAVGQRNSVRAVQPGGSHDAPASRLARPREQRGTAWAPGHSRCPELHSQNSICCCEAPTWHGACLALCGCVLLSPHIRPLN